MDLLDKNVVCWVLYSNALVLVGNLNIVHPDIAAPDIDSVQTTFVNAMDDSVIYFAIGACIQRQMEYRGCISNQQIVTAGNV